jgi:putative FmdB family regulatory protein
LPLYEYECDRCHHRFEKLQRLSDPPVKKCPACAGPVSQVMSVSSVQFKGTGWYATDYARKPSGDKPATEKKAGSEKPAEKSSDTSAASAPKTEAKTAAPEKK